MTEWITSLVESMGYLGIAFLMFLENVFPPIPSELIMPLAGFVSARGELNFIGVVAAGSAGSVLGQLPLYYLGRRLGEKRMGRAADRYGKWLTISHEEIERAGNWFTRHGPSTVFFCRLIPGVRSLISIPAGIHRMPLWKFLIYSIMGIVIWSSLLATAGSLLGRNYQYVQQYIDPIGYAVFGILAITFVVWILKRKRKMKREKQPHE